MESNLDDSTLLRRYADEKSEEAFAALVQRHLDLVYSVALRQVGGDAHLAQDVAQTVFTALARKASELAGRPVLGGWIYRTTQFTAIDVVRAESRRRAREQEALINTMHDFALTPNPGSAVDWEKLRPTLDEAIGELNDDDRDAVVLRYFEGKSFADVGAKLRLTENTARMRVERALDKLHGLLVRRGVTSTTGALAAVLANQAGVAAPAGLAAAVTGVALASGGSAAGGVAAGTAGLFAFMNATKITTGIVASVAVLSTGAAIFGLKQVRERDAALAALELEREALQVTLAEATQNMRLAKSRAAEAEKDNGELLAAIEAAKSQAEAQENARLAQRRAVEAEKNNGRIIGAVMAGTPSGLDPREQERLAQERAYQQELAKRRAGEARARAELDFEASKLDATSKFNRLIEAAETFAAKAEFAAAVRAYNQAMAAKPPEVPVPDRVRELQAALRMQNTPVEITLASDGVTWVSIRNGMAPAQFVTNTPRILPGNYEVRGTRRGYHDVVLQVQVRGGQPPPELTVVCTQLVTP